MHTVVLLGMVRIPAFAGMMFGGGSRRPGLWKGPAANADAIDTTHVAVIQSAYFTNGF